MTTRRALARLMLFSLGALLASCSTTHHTAPANADELEGLALILQEAPDGHVSHSWQRVEELDLSRYRSRASTHATGRIVLAAARQRDCHEEFNHCQDDCMSRALPPGYEHVKQGSGAHRSLCRKNCWQPYLDCEELQERQGVRPREFTAIDGAVDWLKRNHKTILVGTVVVIAGVAFVAVSAGVGVVILAPVALVASAGAPSQPHLAAVSP